MEDQFIKKFQIKELMLREYHYWVLSLRPQQPTLGSMVLSLKRRCDQMGDLTDEETKELSVIFHHTEQTLRKIFNHDKINYLALMMVDSQVHFHIIPRYATPRTFNDKTFTDVNWPKPPDILSGQCDHHSLNRLRDHLKKYWDEAFA